MYEVRGNTYAYELLDTETTLLLAKENTDTVVHGLLCHSSGRGHGLREKLWQSRISEFQLAAFESNRSMMSSAISNFT